ncbi:MAG: SDR family oxidoreductase [SAR202 cluster bacterium]|nr:SDR family oxidoreductase [SAR202 cluster bacterium]
MSELFNLEGKVALITGGNSGIGKGIADGLAAAGSDIVIAARDIEKSNDVATSLEKKYQVNVMALTVDVSNEDDITDMPRKIRSRFEKIDIVVNNAGVNIRKMPEDFSSAEWDQVIDTNLKGTFLCCKTMYPDLSKTGGKVINIGSMTSVFGSAKTAAYSASKGAIVQLTRSLAVAWAKDNIQVNALLPGWIDTPLTVGSRQTFPTLNEHIEQRCPAGRWGIPEDFAGPATFLASKASDFITGESIFVDGGYSQSTLII